MAEVYITWPLRQIKFSETNIVKYTYRVIQEALSMVSLPCQRLTPGERACMAK